MFFGHPGGDISKPFLYKKSDEIQFLYFLMLICLRTLRSSSATRLSIPLEKGILRLITRSAEKIFNSLPDHLRMCDDSSFSQGSKNRLFI